MRDEKIGIVGSGLIGRAWAMLFASAGYRVTLYDILPEQVTQALQQLEQDLRRLEAEGTLRGSLDARAQFACIEGTTELRSLVAGKAFIQECIPERLDWKRQLYGQLDGLLEAQTVVASSTSTFMPSLFSETLRHRGNVVVAHPLNPPYFIPLVEIVPAPWTRPEAVARTRALMLEIGQRPVTLRREVEGFATNRIQYAILNEVWRLVGDGVLSVRDVESVMTDGLGLRYALLGPLQTAHLNAPGGVVDYFGRFGGEIWSVSQTFGPPPRTTAAEEAATLAEIGRQCEALVPRGEALARRRQERDEFLTRLGQLKRSFS